MKLRQQHQHDALMLGVLLLAISAGCGRYSRVNWGNPGRAEMQQNRAIAQHDPYPDPEAGPEVVGGRPREFDTPPPEAAWLQKRASPFFSPHSNQPPPFSAQPVNPAPVYTTPVYPPPNTGAPVYQPPFIPAQPGQPGYSTP